MVQVSEHWNNYLFRNCFCLSDPGTTQVSKTEEESKSATPSSTKVASKVEDVADANKTKRQRRQRSSTTEQTVKEEEKKVGCKNMHSAFGSWVFTKW